MSRYVNTARHPAIPTRIGLLGRVARAGSLAGFALLGPSVSAVRADQALVHVFVNSRQESGRPWHGIGDPVIGPFILKSPNEAPGAVLCVVRSSGDASCARRGPTGLESPCPQSFDCDFRHTALPPEEIFGLLVLDPAMVFTHLIDAVVVTRTALDDETVPVRRMDNVLRLTAARLAPPFFQEVQRRSRPFPMVQISDCDPACTLRQSRLLLRIEAPR